MKRISIIILIIIACCLYGSAQTDYKPNIFYPAPSTQAYTKFMDNYVKDGVNPSGIKTITIPLYNINFEGVDIPISVSYQTRGIRYGEDSGELGAGWTLTPGHRVSRVIMGREDEQMDIQKPYLEKPFDQAMGLSDMERDKFLAGYLPDMSPIVMYSFLGTQPKKDSGYDHYSYSTISGNGDFVFLDMDKNNYISTPGDNLKIAMGGSGGRINGMSLIDKNGFHHSYGYLDNIKEVVRSKFDDYRLLDTAWPLAYIESPLGKEIKFDYKMDYNIYHDKKDSIFYTVSDCVYFHDPSDKHWSAFPIIDVTAQKGTENNDPMQDYYGTFRLTKIETEKEIILFERNDNYPHSNNSIRLTQIIVKSKLDNSTVKRVKFNYTANSVPHYLLKSIEISGANNLNSPEIYHFNYYDENKLISRYDNTALADALKGYIQDQWGFYVDGSTKNRTTSAHFHKEFDMYEYMDVGFPRYIGNIVERTKMVTEDRSSNKRGEQFSLQKIKFPTGGELVLNYEPNSFTAKDGLYPDQKIERGGGIRLKSEAYFDNNILKRKINYIYGKNQNGYGEANLKVNNLSFISETINYYTFMYKACDHCMMEIRIGSNITRQFSQNPLGDVNLSQHFSVQYPQVITKEEGGGNGWTIDEYEIKHSYEGGYLPRPLFPHRGDKYNDFKTTIGAKPIYIQDYKYNTKSLLKSKAIYDDTGKKIKEVIYEYENSKTKIEFIKVARGLFIDEGLSYALGGEVEAHNAHAQYYHQIIDFMRSNIIFESDLLTKTTEISDNGFQQINAMEYDTMNRIKKETTYNSNGNIIQTEYSYPAESSELFSKNIVANPIKTEKKVKGILSNGMETTYKANTIFPESVITYSKDSQNRRTEITYDEYDKKGNILQYQTRNGIITSVLWSYNNQYPIAKIEGINYSTLKTLFGNEINNYNAMVNPSLTTIEAIEKKIKNNYPDCFVTLFHYKPLVGISTQIEPNGIRTSYEYDEQNRLKRISQFNPHSQKNEIIQEYDYYLKK